MEEIIEEEFELTSNLQELREQVLSFRRKYREYQKTKESRTRLQLIDEIEEIIPMLKYEIGVQNAIKHDIVSPGKINGQFNTTIIMDEMYESRSTLLSVVTAESVFGIPIVLGVAICVSENVISVSIAATLAFLVIVLLKTATLSSNGYIPSLDNPTTYLLRLRIARHDQEFKQASANVREISKAIRLLRYIRFKLYFT